MEESDRAMMTERQHGRCRARKSGEERVPHIANLSNWNPIEVIEQSGTAGNDAGRMIVSCNIYADLSIWNSLDD